MLGDNLMVIINTKYGSFEGLTHKNLDLFLGIPYAYPPIGHRRFKHASPIYSYDTLVDATQFRAIPPQPFNKLETFFSTTKQKFQPNEDCLHLNIWRQSTGKAKKPVIIYFYGGGFINGHGSAELYTPEHIVEQYDVIVITFNYRLGVLGFLDWSYFNAHYDKNNGLSDQIAVLKWVAHFIKYFGGDPDNVTLWGQSAGSMSIQALMQQPQLDHYYHQVMLLSGILQLDSAKTGMMKAQHFDDLMQQHFSGKSINDLDDQAILQLMAYDAEARGKSKGLELIYQPIKDSKMCRPLTEFNKPIVLSYTKDEGDCYIRNESRKLSPQRFVDVMKLNHIHVDFSRVQTGKQQAHVVTELYFKQPTITLLQQMSNNSYRWLLRFDWARPEHVHFASAYHILDLVFWFGKMDILQGHSIKLSNNEFELSKRMISDLVHYARTGTMPYEPYSINNLEPHVNK